MNKQLQKGLIVSFLVVVVGLAAWYGHSVWARQQAEQRAIEFEKQAEIERAQQRELAKAIEDILNGLLSDVQQRAVSYKQERRVLTEIVQPMNLSSADYIQENYALMQRTIPSIRGAMDDIMLAFEQADDKVKQILSGVAPERQERLLAQWKEMNTRYVQAYIRFFEIEDKLIDAHSQLMTFYAEHTDAFSYDPDSDQLVFIDAALKEQEADLKVHIKELSLEQAQSLLTSVNEKSSGQGQAAPEQEDQSHSYDRNDEP